MAHSTNNASETTKIEAAISKLEKIQFGLRQNLADLHKHLEVINSEPKLLFDIENFKKDAETRASNLEVEVKQLRQEIKALRELLGLNFEKRDHASS
jgi:cell shape-determining protein MreC